LSKVEWIYYNDGTVNWETPFVNGQVHGITKCHYKNGTVEYKTPFVNGRQHGVQEHYDEEGVLKSKILWIEGKIRNDLLGDKHRLERLMLLGEQG